MFEYEKKVMLTAEEYGSLLMSLCVGICPTIQTNYYFDTPDFAMNRKKITCRIRGKEGRFKATIKDHKTGCAECSAETVISDEKEYDPSVFHMLGLYCHGELVTERRVLFKDNFCEAVIDRNTYLGCTDYELEVEYTAGSERKAQLLLEEIAYALMHIGTSSGMNTFYERMGSGKSKSERFFERKCLERKKHNAICLK